MALADPVLNELADRYAIATEFWDWKGRHTQVSDETVVKILAALDIDASDPTAAERALWEADNRAWRRPLPPVVVVQQGQDPYVNVHVAAGHWSHVYLRLEDGTFRDGWQVDNWAGDREIDGQWIGEATYRLPADLPLGYHTLFLESDDREAQCPLIVTPAFVGFPDTMGTKRIWGYQAQLYSVRSRDSWGVGDLVDLADLATWSGGQGAGYLLINPLHAAQASPPLESSPYLPSSRRFLNPVYIRPEAIDEFHSLSALDRERVGRLHTRLMKDIDQADQAAEDDGSGVPQRIRRSEAMAAKLDALRIVHAAPRRAARELAYQDFVRRGGDSLRDFALWSALSVHFEGLEWGRWPAAYRDKDSTEVASFAATHASEIDFYCWLQWVADDQLSRAQLAATNAGMPVGVVTDLAVGTSLFGADTWTLQDIYAQGVRVGAPPDPYNQMGQEWGQPPWRPDRLEEVAYAPFREMVASALRHSGGLRVDHIIGLFRMWWIPAGEAPTKGTYVRYNHEAMVGILALEAKRAGAMVVGEDLGTVEPWVRDYLRARGILGTSVLWFEYDEAGQPLHADRWRDYCMASVVTHDLPPTAGYLAGDHIRLRHRLGLLTESLEEEQRQDDEEKANWARRLTEYGVIAPGDTDEESMLLGLHRYLMRTPARVVNAALVDAVGDRRTQNQPGTFDEYPNWQVPLSGPDGEPLMLDQVFQAKRARLIADVFNSRETA